MFGSPSLRFIADLLIFLAAGVAGGVIGYLLMKSRQLQSRNDAEALVQNAQVESRRIVAEAESKAKTIALAALNLFAGFCVGCAVYYWLQKLGLPGFTRQPPAGIVPGMRPRS